MLDAGGERAEGGLFLEGDIKPAWIVCKQFSVLCRETTLGRDTKASPTTSCAEPHMCQSCWSERSSACDGDVDLGKRPNVIVCADVSPACSPCILQPLSAAALQTSWQSNLENACTLQHCSRISAAVRGSRKVNGTARPKDSSLQAQLVHSVVLCRCAWRCTRIRRASCL